MLYFILLIYYDFYLSVRGIFMVVTCNSFGVSGMDGYKVELEASMYNGTREFDMVGLPDVAVRESKDRVLSALKNCGFRYPAAHMTVNLAPADIKKKGLFTICRLRLQFLYCSIRLRATSPTAHSSASFRFREKSEESTEFCPW